jgi:hypothetical protein
MRPKLASPSRFLPEFAAHAVAPDVPDPVTQGRLPSVPERPVRQDGRRVNFNLLRIFRRGASRVLTPIPLRCNAAIREATLLTFVVPITGWPPRRLYHNNAHRPRVSHQSSVVERPRSVNWMDDDVLSDHGRIVAAGCAAQPDGDRRRNARTGRLEQRQAIGLVPVAALRGCHWSHRLCRRHIHVGRDQTRYENTSSDHSDDDVGERRRRTHGTLVRGGRLRSKPVSAFNASYGAGVPAFASAAEARSAMVLASTKLKSSHSRDRDDMSWLRVGPEGSTSRIARIAGYSRAGVVIHTPCELSTCPDVVTAKKPGAPPCPSPTS